MTDLSATERRRLVRRINFVRAPLIGVAGAAALFLVARLGLRPAGGLSIAEIELVCGFAVLICMLSYCFRGPFRPPLLAATPPALVICAMMLHPAHGWIVQLQLPAVLRWPASVALTGLFFIPIRRWIMRYFRRTLTEYPRTPANDSAAQVMVQECARLAKYTALSPVRRKIARLNQARALTVSDSAPTAKALLEAVEILEELADEHDPLPERFQMFQAVLDLARTITARADRHGDLTGYAEALDLLITTAEKLSEDEGAATFVHAFTAQFELAYAAQAPTAHQDTAAHFKAAADATRRSIEAVTPAVHHLLPELYANLGLYTAQLEDERDELEVLDDAIVFCGKGIRAAGHHPRRRAPAELALSDLLQRRAWVHLGRLTKESPETAWDPIVANLREARRLSARVRRTGTSAQRREAAEQLASVLSDMERLGGSYAEPTIAAQWRQSAVMSERGFTGTAIRVCTEWVEWAESTDNPRWCAEAYESLMALLPRAAASQYLSEERDRLLAGVQDRAAEAGYWLSRHGRLREAAVALERGRAVTVSELSSRNDPAFELVSGTSPHHELAERLRNATEQLARAERQAQAQERTAAHRSKFTTPVQSAWSEFDTVRREIGQELGIELGSSIEYWDIADAAGEGPIVYLVCADRGGYALIIRADVEPEWVPLPTFSREHVEKHTYLPYQRLDDSGDYDGTLLNGVLRWLWENGVAHVADQLPENAVVTLVPMGLLGLLPIHAAGGPALDPFGGFHGDSPAEWEHLIDRVAVRYATSARIQARLPKRTMLKFEPSTLLAFDAPNGDPEAPLKSTRAELDSVCRHWPRELRTRLDGAARDEVVAALGRHTVWHFAGHCEITPEEIRKSTLLLEDARLTFDDLSAVPYAPRRLAVLSACRSHRSSEQLPDEVVGIPAVLLLAGFAGVLATHWNVGDESAAFVAARFYQAWREEHRTPTEALRLAQGWLRRATREELDAYLPGVLPRSHSGAPSTTEIPPEAAERPYAQPHSWAPFALTGL